MKAGRAVLGVAELRASEGGATDAIWNYTVVIYSTLHGVIETEERIRISDFVKLFPTEEMGENLIDVGESAFEHAVFRAPRQIHAVTLQIRVTEQHGAMWERFLTIEGPQTAADKRGLERSGGAAAVAGG